MILDVSGVICACFTSLVKLTKTLLPNVRETKNTFSTNLFLSMLKAMLTEPCWKTEVVFSVTWSAELVSIWLMFSASVSRAINSPEDEFDSMLEFAISSFGCSRSLSSEEITSATTYKSWKINQVWRMYLYANLCEYASYLSCIMIFYTVQVISSNYALLHITTENWNRKGRPFHGRNWRNHLILNLFHGTGLFLYSLKSSGNYSKTEREVPWNGFNTSFSEH